MKVSFDITPRKVFSGLGWGVVGGVLLMLLLIVFSLLNSPGGSGAGMVIIGIMFMAVKHFYLVLIPIVTVGLGVAYDVKRGKSAIFALFKWFLAGLALYVLVLALLIQISVFH